MSASAAAAWSSRARPAVCSPSRATLLTGQYSHTHGVIDNNNRNLDPKKPIVSDRLREAGYEVAFCGKSHVGGNLRQYKWDYYFGYKGQGSYLKPVIAEGTDGKDVPYDGYVDDVVTDHAVNWLKGKHEKPICLFLFFKAPHRSWDRAARHKDLFKDVEPRVFRLAPFFHKAAYAGRLFGVRLVMRDRCFSVADCWRRATRQFGCVLYSATHGKIASRNSSPTNTKSLRSVTVRPSIRARPE